MSLQQIEQLSHLSFIGASIPLDDKPRLSWYPERKIYSKHDDLAPIAMDGSKLHKLEFLVASTLRQGRTQPLSFSSHVPDILWHDYFAPFCALPNTSGMEAIKLLASLEGILSVLAKLWPGSQAVSAKIASPNPILFIHTTRHLHYSLTLLPCHCEFHHAQHTTIDTGFPAITFARYAIHLTTKRYQHVLWLATWLLTGTYASVIAVHSTLAGAGLYLHFSRYSAYRTVVYDLLRPATNWH